jgi:putative ABC transport system permease protein
LGYSCSLPWAGSWQEFANEASDLVDCGATSSRVMRDVIWEACALTGTGVVIGSAAAWMLTRLLANLFLGVSPHDPTILVGAPVVFAVVALAAASIPAFRTTRVNPVVPLTAT